MKPHRLQMRMGPTLWSELRAMAVDDGLTFTALVMQILSDYVIRRRVEEKAAMEIPEL